MVRRTEPDPDFSPEPADLDERLGEAIEVYLGLAEGGSPPEAEAFALGYPELGADLLAALEGLALVKGLVGGPSGLGHGLEEGRRVAGYRIVRELGRGGMGIVYEAVHVGLDRPVALKVLGSQAAPDSSGRRRFLNEAKTAAGLHHTHIVPVFDVGQVGGLCYYAMQRIEGSGLDRVLRHLRRDRTVAAGSSLGSGSNRSSKPGQAKGAARPVPAASHPVEAAPLLSGLGDETLSWGDGAAGPLGRREPVDEPPPFVPPRGSAYYRWVAEVGRQAAEALAHAHRRGVIHRDIKPSNLLVDARGMIWVADFGLARRLADPSQTQVDSLLGTPRYMSPEQARPGAIDGRADVYSLGATLYELVTLRPPFDGQTAAELIDQIGNKEPQAPRRFDPRLPLDLETILLKALSKRPGDRYAGAAELAEDLARYLAHEPVRARRIGPAGRLWRFARRHPSVTAVSLAASTIVLTTATLAHVRVVAERDEARKAQRETREAQAETEIALRKSTRSRLGELEKHAAAVLVTTAVNRRATGLDLLQGASALKPDPATLARLRDQAVGFLALRDVEVRPSIAANAPHGLAFGPDGRRVAALRGDNTEVDIWGVEGGKLLDSVQLDPRGTGRDRGRGPGGPGLGPAGQPNPNRGPGGRRIAASGTMVALVRPDGAGLRLFDLAAPGLPADDLPTAGLDVISMIAAPNGSNLVTLDRPWRDDRGPGGGGRPEAEEIRVHLWDRNRSDAPRTTLALPAPNGEGQGQPGRPQSQRLLLAIAPDGSTIAAARLGETEVSLWDGEGKSIGSMDLQVNLSALALGPDRLLAVAGGSEIRVWDLARRKSLYSLGRRQGFVHQLRFSPRDGALLAATTWPASGVELWDLTSNALVAALPTRDDIADIAFSPDGATLAATQSGSIALWSIAEPVGQIQLPESGEQPIALAFGPGDRLAIASFEAGTRTLGPLRIWGGPGRCPPEVDAWDQVKPVAVGFDDRGRVVTLELPVAGQLDAGGLRWFDPTSPGHAVAEVPFPREPRRGADAAPSPAVGEVDRRKGRGPASQGDAPQGPGAGRPDRRSFTRSRDGRTFAFARGGEILAWDAGKPGQLRKLGLPKAQAGPPGRGLILLALAPDGSRLYQCGYGGNRLAAYDLGGPEGKPSRLLWSAEVRECYSLAVAPEGRTLAVGERSGDLALVDATLGTVRRQAAPSDDAGAITALAFAPEGQVLAVGARDVIRLWSVAGPRPHPLVRLPGHRGSLSALAFDAPGHRLAGADEKVTRVWDLAKLHAELGRLGLGW